MQRRARRGTFLAFFERLRCWPALVANFLMVGGEGVLQELAWRWEMFVPIHQLRGRAQRTDGTRVNYRCKAPYFMGRSERRQDDGADIESLCFWWLGLEQLCGRGAGCLNKNPWRSRQSGPPWPVVRMNVHLQPCMYFTIL